MPELIPLNEFFYKLFELTKRQTEILLFIMQYRDEHAYSPTIRDVQRHFGFQSSNGALSLILPLVAKGALNRGGRYSGRTMVPAFRFIPASHL